MQEGPLRSPGIEERNNGFILLDASARIYHPNASLSRDTFVFTLVIHLSFLQGERLSHAVGCAFAICLEKKQQRDKLCTVSMTFDASSAAFTRHGSFRQATLTERLQDPQVNKSFCIPW